MTVTGAGDYTTQVRNGIIAQLTSMQAGLPAGVNLRADRLTTDDDALESQINSLPQH